MIDVIKVENYHGDEAVGRELVLLKVDADSKTRSEITQICFLLGAIKFSLSKNPNKWKWVSLWCALLVAVKLVYVVLLPLFFIYAIFQNSNSLNKEVFITRFLDFSSFILPIGIFLALLNYWRFGNIFESGYGAEASSFSFQFLQRDWLDYLISFQRGIFPFNPILLSSIIGCFFIPKEKITNQRVRVMVGVTRVLKRKEGK